MYFEDVVKIKESECCEKCVSYEYDLPCRIDLDIVLILSVLFNSSEEQLDDVNRLFGSSSILQIKKDENLKIELSLNGRYAKLCVPVSDTSFKLKVEDKFIEWISKTLNIGIERKND